MCGGQPHLYALKQGERHVFVESNTLTGEHCVLAPYLYRQLEGPRGSMHGPPIP